MPIRIRETIFRAIITDGEQSPASGQASSGETAPDLHQLVALCVEQVLRKLNAKKER